MDSSFKLPVANYPESETLLSWAVGVLGGGREYKVRGHLLMSSTFLFRDRPGSATTLCNRVPSSWLPSPTLPSLPRPSRGLSPPLLPTLGLTPLTLSLDRTTWPAVRTTIRTTRLEAA